MLDDLDDVDEPRRRGDRKRDDSNPLGFLRASRRYSDFWPSDARRECHQNRRLTLPTQQYLDSAEKFTKLPSNVDYARIQRITGGSPVHLDAVIEAMQVTSLEGALAQIDAESSTAPAALPASIVHEINSLTDAQDSELAHSALIWTLSVLERGEALSVIKRLDGRNPIWPKHAAHLEKKDVSTWSTPRKIRDAHIVIPRRW